MNVFNYPFLVKPLNKEDGGGYLVEFPDLPGCFADGKTVEEALTQAEDALLSWLKTSKEFGDFIPNPSRYKKYSGQWRLRVPKSLHEALAERAKQEGVSLNNLAATILAAGVGETFIHHR